MLVKQHFTTWTLIHQGESGLLLNEIAECTRFTRNNLKQVFGFSFRKYAATACQDRGVRYGCILYLWTFFVFDRDKSCKMIHSFYH